MQEKLKILMENKGLNTTTLARKLDIQPSGITHLLSGRNKPSFNLVVKILRAFPDINPDWLLLDSEQMSRNSTESEQSYTPPAEEEHGSEPDQLFAEQENNEISESYPKKKNDAAPIFCHTKNGAKTVERFVVLYTDGSFDVYNR